MKKILAVILMLVIFLTTFASCTKVTVPVDTASTDQSANQQVPPAQENGEQNNNANNEENKDEENKDEENKDENEGEEEANEDECDHEGGEDATCITESICSICDEFYGGFDEGNHEGEEEWVSTESSHRLVYSCCELIVEEDAAHSFVDGVCSVCKYECTDHDSDGHGCKICHAFISHSYSSDNKCSVCGLARNGKKVTFGSYPQSEVTNSSLKSTLNSKSSSWISNNGMWYCDVENDGNKYRGVKTTSNGTASWFKYDSISWTILEEKDGKALVLCDMIIDAKEFSNGDNNYANSTIRAWLNKTFINDAFDELQQQVIVTTLVNNGNSSTGYVNARFTCDDTNDKIFLLSRSEIKNTAYGFDSDGLAQDAARKKLATAYAIFNIKDIYDATNGAWWWLRTPAPHNTDVQRTDLAHTIKINGTVNSTSVGSAQGGVVPAMWINI